MTDELLLYVIETNPEQAKNLRLELRHLHQVVICETYAAAVARSGHLDAIFVPLMAALDWGVIAPPVPLHQTLVIKMPASEILRGRPHFAIPGIATSPQESLNPAETTRLILRESFKAIRNFNQNNEGKLRSVGVASLSLGLEKLSPGDALRLLTDAYRLFSPEAGSSDITASHQHPTTLIA